MRMDALGKELLTIVTGGTSARAQPPIDNLKGNQAFGDEALKGVVPTRPAVKEASLEDERVEKDSERCRPGGTSHAVCPSERVDVRCQKMLRLRPRILLLRDKPAGKRLSIIVKDYAGQGEDLANNHDSMAVPLVS